MVKDDEMRKLSFRLVSCGFLASALLFVSGCIGIPGPSLGIFSIPVPVSPYFQGAYEDMAFEKDRYGQIPVLPPIVEDIPEGLDEPSDDEVMRLLDGRIREHPEDWFWYNKRWILQPVKAKGRKGRKGASRGPRT